MSYQRNPGGYTNMFDHARFTSHTANAVVVGRQLEIKMMPNRQREKKYSYFGFTKKSTLVPYVPKKGKSVVLLSAMHLDHSICEDDDKKTT